MYKMNILGILINTFRLIIKKKVKQRKHRLKRSQIFLSN